MGKVNQGQISSPPYLPGFDFHALPSPVYLPSVSFPIYHALDVIWHFDDTLGMGGMGRLYAELQVNGRKLWTLFDTGSKNSYVTDGAVGGLPRQSLAKPRQVGLGGRVRQASQVCLIDGTLAGKSIDVDAYITEELGTDESGRTIDLLFGALAMQKWHIHLKPDEERLDLTHYPEEFIEY